jgi:Post-segregation antitoxin CcdA
MTSVAKRKVSVTVDADLVEEIEAAGDNVSARVTEALRTDMAARRRQRALGQLLDRLEITEGPLDTAEDEAEIQRFMRLLGGTAARDAADPATETRAR